MYVVTSVSEDCIISIFRIEMSQVGDLILLYRGSAANGNGENGKKGEGRGWPMGMGKQRRSVKGEGGQWEWR